MLKKNLVSTNWCSDTAWEKNSCWIIKAIKEAYKSILYILNEHVSHENSLYISNTHWIYFTHDLSFLDILHVHCKKISEFLPKIVWQLKIQMGRKFFQRYSRKYFWHRTGNSFYCLVGEVYSLLEKIDIFHNLSGKRSRKCERISAFHGKNFLHLRRFVKCSFLFYIFPNSSEISPKIRSIFLKSMKYFHFQ